jgi:imidazoleglycerol-phosphate dehydratase
MRTAEVKRKTKETDIAIKINIDGTGNSNISTSIPFLDHMLNLFSFHGKIDLNIKAKGDIEIDYHHLIEDIGITLGEAIKEALGDKKGIKRYGEATVPMDESLSQVVIDLSGRPYLVYKVEFPKKSKLKDFDPDIIEDFLQAFVSNSGVTLHINVLYGRNTHHIIEAIFKGLGRALREAVTIDPRIKGLPTTKGKL